MPQKPTEQIIWFEGSIDDVIKHAAEKGPDFCVIGFELNKTTTSIVEAFITQLTSHTIINFSGWLPDSTKLTQGDPIGLVAVESIARNLGQSSDLYEPFLVAISKAAFTNQKFDPLERYPSDLVIDELMKLVCRSSGEKETFIVIDFNNADLKNRHLKQEIHWLEARCPFQMVILTNTSEVKPKTDKPIYPPDSGIPSPISAVEQRLEEALLYQPWATGRSWNANWQESPTSIPFRLDLTWKNENCIVELDGADHRAKSKYQADRIRDRQLQRNGLMVLRFTNEEVLQDTRKVVKELEITLTKLRKKT